MGVPSPWDILGAISALSPFQHLGLGAKAEHSLINAPDCWLSGQYSLQPQYIAVVRGGCTTPRWAGCNDASHASLRESLKF